MGNEAGPGVGAERDRGPEALEMRRAGDRLALAGPLDLRHLPGADAMEGVATLDLGGLTRLDTAGAWFLHDAQLRGVTLEALPAARQPLLDAVVAAWPTPDPPAPKAAGGWRQPVEAVGRAVAAAAGYLGALAEYLGRFLARLAYGLTHPGSLRVTALVHHSQQVGLAAVPIVVTISFLIGVVIAYQGAWQLRSFGAEIFTVDLVAISVLRELAVLLTAIVVAGRSGAAITAAIGAMKMREEVDAMRVLDINPDDALIVPRVLALVLMMPILALIADIAGLAGGAVMAWLTLDITPMMFVQRVAANTGVNHAATGLAKAPIFGLLIGVIACHAGMQVGGDTESLGRRTSQSVVSAIFAVILADALFSIFFARVGW
ncbi:ABC transporter permease [Paracoccus sanguinis]|uniref:ABC transporter permease n=1 Tax=Paracoccus sanguinis TaxID=1545044 RepID=UPI000B167E7B|nr:ABC transporter permease [Paracoccus sanguinis]